MLRSVSDIVLKDFVSIKVLDSLRKVRSLAVEKNLDYFPIFDENELVGVLTYKDLLKAPPDMIVAEAMSSGYISISPDASIWEAEDIFKKYDTDILLAIDQEKLIGLVPKTLLYIELGKHTDFLTGFYRSDYIYHNAIQLIKKGSEISIIFIDVNNFGYINKEYGHIFGDTTLRELATLLKNCIPNDTYICRFGGDEFVILTPYELDRCIVLANHLLEISSSHKFSNDINVSIAAGIAGGRRNNALSQNSLSIIENLVNLASLASTKAKKECNGRLCIAD